ncbi:hypothetical protein PR048_009596 [Dryococelus australis]|uniref:Uncharacterized protein n=1 Tax=Dryococelus australis TaxID=614101 RepID=A0ABQ9I0F6_9NEOP|nr:hypothetical protein PR048_009596 [Dryococelus australis]
MADLEKPETCIFCDGSTARQPPLHVALTDEIDKGVRSGATLLRDTKILCKITIQEGGEKALKNEQLKSIALANTIASMKEEEEDAEVAPIFKMSDICIMDKKHLGEFNLETNIHSTRLRYRILDTCPDLEAWGKQGKEWMLAFKRDAGAAMDVSCPSFDLEALDLDIFKHEIDTSPKSLLTSGQRESIPESLFALISLNVNGPLVTVDETETSNRNQAILSIAQLISFNTYPNTRKVRNLPIPMYLVAKVHSETRKKELVDILYNLGLGISHELLRSISTDIANELCCMYSTKQVVCTPNLYIALFTTACIDNIDHNPSSNTAKSFLHGTAMSLMQHPILENSGHTREAVLQPECTKIQKDPSCALFNRNQITEPEELILPHLESAPNIKEYEWLEQTLNLNLSSQQTLVLVSDQPLFALMKQIQYSLSKEHGEDKFVMMIGGLHIEQADLRMAGHCLEGSG